MKKTIGFIVFHILFFTICGTAQIDKDSSLTLLRPGEYYGTTTIAGKVVKVLIIDGDTLPVLDLETIQVTQKRNFTSRDERKRYHQWRNYAVDVYPYAAEAIKIFRQVELETAGMRRAEKKRYTKQLEKDLKPEYEQQLKELTKTQGFILIKMVERELGETFFDVIKQIRGKGAATKWQTLGRFYGYNLKKGYDPEEDPLLEMILMDLNISYDAEAEE